MRSTILLTAALLAGAPSGCYSPQPSDCAITCTADCPDGLTCREGFCRTPGATGSCGAFPDAAGADGPAVDVDGSAGPDGSPADGGAPDARPCLGPGDCVDGNPCTIDVCFMNTCNYAWATDGAECDDGLFCTGADTCASGVCQHAGDPCSAPGACDETNGWCTCDDGNACTGPDHVGATGCAGDPLSGAFCGACNASGCAICCGGACHDGTQNAYCAGCTPCSGGESCQYSATSACGWLWCCTT